MTDRDEKTPSCCAAATPAPPAPAAPAAWRRYTPLIALIALALLATGAKQVHYGSWEGRTWEGRAAMHDFMGLFLLSFSMLKFFDLAGFAEGFQQYDLLASKSRAYALLYPFLELALALGYLSHWQPTTVFLATIILMTFGAIGVFRSLSRGLDIQCACMGSTLNVPLSTVAVIEDVGMALMALAMLLL